MSNRFEAVLYEGEPNERLPEWRVVEWTYLNPENGSKSGKTVWRTYDMEFGEREAKDVAYQMQQVYNWEFAEEFA